MTMIPSVNYHIWQACNMRCKFCFATFQDVKRDFVPKGHLPKEESVKLIREIAKAGYEKITFVGGEPTLCPWLPELIHYAKSCGLTTMIVSNGSLINDEFLFKVKGYLDWITLSIDSLDHDVNINSGRAIRGKIPLSREFYKRLCIVVKAHGFGLKINSVFSSYNQENDLPNFVADVKPERWKVFQALLVEGQNEGIHGEFLVSSDSFNSFRSQVRAKLPDSVPVVFENNEDMTGTYSMIDPAGRFFDNVLGFYRYSDPILQVGLESARKQITQDIQGFLNRDGLYDWKRY